jgi:hypothetical protein
MNILIGAQRTEWRWKLYEFSKASAQGQEASEVLTVTDVDGDEQTLLISVQFDDHSVSFDLDLSILIPDMDSSATQAWECSNLFPGSQFYRLRDILIA